MDSKNTGCLEALFEDLTFTLHQLYRQYQQQKYMNRNMSLISVQK